MTNPIDYQFWKDALLKRTNRVDVQVPVDKPSCGYFEYRPHGGARYQPVAIWRGKDGNLICKVGTEKIDPLKVWNFCAARPISEEAYREAASRPDTAEPESPPQAGDNKPPSDEFAGFDRDAESLLNDARTWIKSLEGKQVETQEQADRAAVLVNDLRKLKGDGDKKRLAATKPLRDETDEINKRWNALIEPMGKAIETLLARITIFNSAQKAKAAEVEAQTGMKVEAPKAGAGVARRAITNREITVVEVTSPADAAAYYALNPRIMEIVISLARTEFDRTGKNPPGCKCTKEEKAK